MSYGTGCLADLRGPEFAKVKAAPDVGLCAQQLTLSQLERVGASALEAWA